MSTMDQSDAAVNCQDSSPNNGVRDATQDLEDNSVSDNNVFGGCTFDAASAVNGLDDLEKISFNHMSAEDVMRFHFPDISVVFMFYNWYASLHGFAARKSKVMRNCKGEITQQTFLCHREGSRDVKYVNKVGRTSMLAYLPPI